jgi:hypothetical protein
VEDVEVRPAHAGGVDAHDRVVSVDQLGLCSLLDADHAGGLEGDCSHGARSLLICLGARRVEGTSDAEHVIGVYAEHVIGV